MPTKCTWSFLRSTETCFYCIQAAENHYDEPASATNYQVLASDGGYQVPSGRSYQVPSDGGYQVPPDGAYAAVPIMK